MLVVKEEEKKTEKVKEEEKKVEKVKDSDSDDDTFELPSKFKKK